MIQRVHVVFKTHLDIGFTDLARNVVEGYFTRHIPGAIALAKRMRDDGRPERFVWTTGSWLIYEYLEQAPESQRRCMEEAIAAGDVVWHGLPFTSHSELMDKSLFRYGLRLAAHLDRRFGRRTIAAKMTDVPGHTRAIVPLLAEAGIEFLHIGVNPACPAPEVPDVFVWRHTDGAEITVMYHKASYGESMTVPGLPDAIAFAHTGDNQGPQGPDEVRRAFATLRQQFPGADVRASTLNDFACALRSVKASLPVVTAELGDTWIHGVGSDPMKVAQFRALCRLRKQWIVEGKATIEDPVFRRFSDHLLPVAEHTWGLDMKTHLADTMHYPKAEFQQVRGRAPFQKMEASWKEQRQYVDRAVEWLDRIGFAAEARAALAGVEPSAPDIAGYQEVLDPGAPIETRHFHLALNPKTGAIADLVQKATNRSWAGARHELAQVRYEVFAKADYDRYLKQYAINLDNPAIAGWAIPDLSKPGMEKAVSGHQTWVSALRHWRTLRDASGVRLVAELGMPAQAVKEYGCPERFVLELAAPDAAPELHLTLQWFGKDASRVTEAIWLSFSPVCPKPEAWRLDKMGESISPLDVIRKGNRRLHAVQSGVSYDDGQGRLAIDSLDAALVAPGEPALLRFDDAPLPLEKGMHFNLLNNVFPTNFPLWYEDDGRFRFTLQFA